jgi:hypothetical protein
MFSLTRLVQGNWYWCMAARFYPMFRILDHLPKLKELGVKLDMVSILMPSSRLAMGLLQQLRNHLMV